MGFEQELRLRRQAGLAGESSAHAGFDWDGLRARFAAARSCRLAFGPAQVAETPGGSFDARAARSLLAWGKAQRGVNPTALADGKDVSGKDAIIADATEPGDRGQ
ncbi:MAG: hypothetical protein KGL44_04245 [Sphingomonadales bacterium]|nr:hypothetical protein [Sphingomonadales bacterium]